MGSLRVRAQFLQETLMPLEEYKALKDVSVFCSRCEIELTQQSPILSVTYTAIGSSVTMLRAVINGDYTVTVQSLYLVD